MHCRKHLYPDGRYICWVAAGMAGFVVGTMMDKPVNVTGWVLLFQAALLLLSSREHVSHTDALYMLWLSLPLYVLAAGWSGNIKATVAHTTVILLVLMTWANLDAVENALGIRRGVVTITAFSVITFLPLVHHHLLGVVWAETTSKPWTAVSLPVTLFAPSGTGWGCVAWGAATAASAIAAAAARRKTCITPGGSPSGA